MRTDLFLRTYEKDYAWLPYLFRSMIRHVRGFENLVIVYPCDQIGPRMQISLERAMVSAGAVHEIYLHPTDKPYINDYVGQQITKLRSWEYSDADEICFLDSDMVFRREFTPGKLTPGIECREWDSVGDAKCWREPTAKLLGQDPPFETMARHPFHFPRSMIERCYKGVGGEAALLPYSVGQPFSEFNLLGNWALLREGAIPVHVNLGCSTVQVREEDFARQFWSWGGVTPEVIAELKALNVWEDPT